MRLPVRPPTTVLPLKSSSVKFSIFSLDMIKVPSFCTEVCNDEKTNAASQRGNSDFPAGVFSALVVSGVVLRRRRHSQRQSGGSGH